MRATEKGTGLFPKGAKNGVIVTGGRQNMWGQTLVGCLSHKREPVQVFSQCLYYPSKVGRKTVSSERGGGGAGIMKRCDTQGSERPEGTKW